jgi:transcriptional/translational regulatory protein YebC/TACO1
MFSPKGVIIIDAEGVDEEKAMDDFVEAGADDFTFEEEEIEVLTEYNDVDKIAQSLREMGYEVLSAEAAQIPSTYTSIDDQEVAVKMSRLLEVLDDNDDVQNVWHNWENPIEE